MEMAQAVTALPDAERCCGLTQQTPFVTCLPGRGELPLPPHDERVRRAALPSCPPPGKRRSGTVWPLPKKPSTSTLCRPLSTAATATQPLAVIEADAGDLLASLSPAELLQRLDRCPVEALQRHPLAILVLMRRMFTWQQIPK